MAKRVLIEQFHLTALVPATLCSRESQAIRRVLTSHRFRTALKQACARVAKRFPTLRPVHITVSW